MNIARTLSGQEVDSNISYHDGYYMENGFEYAYPHRQFSWSALQLSQAFPDGVAAAKRKIAALKREVILMQECPRSYFRDQLIADMLNTVYIDNPIKVRMDQIKRLESYIYMVQGGKKETIDMLRAKQVPITSWIQVNRAGFASCPLHSDTTPSLKYYMKDNSWWCHQCSTGGDVIDLVRAIKSCSFIEAVKFLS